MPSVCCVAGSLTVWSFDGQGQGRNLRYYGWLVKVFVCRGWLVMVFVCHVRALSSRPSFGDRRVGEIKWLCRVARRGFRAVFCIYWKCERGGL